MTSVAALVRRVLDESGYSAMLQAQDTLEAEGRIENLEELVGVAAEYDQRAEEPDARRLSAGDLALLRHRHHGRHQRAHHLHDAAQRQGPRVSRSSSSPAWKRACSLTSARSTTRTSKRSAAWPTWASRAPWTASTCSTPAQRNLWGGSLYGLPSRFLTEIPADLVEVTRDRRALVSVAAGRAAARAARAGAAGGRRDWDDRSNWRERDDDVRSLGSGRRITGLEKKDGEAMVELFFAPGDRVLHATLGEGTVTAAEQSGIIVVRFENDGSERRLMATIAPLRKLAPDREL